MFVDGEWYVGSMALYPGGRASKCIVQLLDGQLKVKYTYKGMQVTYAGREQDNGHFRLTADVIRGAATLHRFADDTFFDGYWEEEGVAGMWRISVSERKAN